MARCDEGYSCEVCSQDVDGILVSDLYLRFVLGEVPIDRLHRLPERHIRCNPALAQYIVDKSFEHITCEGPFDKRALDPEFVATEEQRVTKAWRRLQTLPGLGLPIDQYPLKERRQ
jgi:hypothetical protein